MRMDIFALSMFGAAGLASVCNYVEQITSANLIALRIVAVGIVVFGICAGLYTNNKDVAKEEAY